jgi:hypothetical protein
MGQNHLVPDNALEPVILRPTALPTVDPIALHTHNCVESVIVIRGEAVVDITRTLLETGVTGRIDQEHSADASD